MFDLIYFIIYFPAWWYLARNIMWALHNEFGFGGRSPDAAEVFFGIFFGAIFALFWPISVTIVLIARLISGRSGGARSLISVVFPEPMTRDEKRRVKEKAHEQALAKREAEVLQYQREVNAQERYLGLTPTVWSNNG